MEEKLSKAEPDSEQYGDCETADRNSTTNMTEIALDLVSSQPFSHCDTFDLQRRAIQLKPEDHVHDSTEQAPHSNCQTEGPAESATNKPIPVAVFRNKSSRQTVLDLQRNYVNPESEHGMNSLVVMESKLQCVEKQTGQILNEYSLDSVADNHSMLSYSKIGKGNTNSIDKPYKCSSCLYSTDKKQYLKEHERKHSTERPYKCSLCSYSAKRQGNLNVHLQKHSADKRYNCSYCSYSTHKKQNLEEHVRTHTGEKPFKCSQCPHRATRKRDLKNHEQTHTHISERRKHCFFKHCHGCGLGHIC